MLLDVQAASDGWPPVEAEPPLPGCNALPTSNPCTVWVGAALETDSGPADAMPVSPASRHRHRRRVPCPLVQTVVFSRAL
jgi:hypothetical protein